MSLPTYRRAHMYSRTPPDATPRHNWPLYHYYFWDPDGAGWTSPQAALAAHDGHTYFYVMHDWLKTWPGIGYFYGSRLDKYYWEDILDPPDPEYPLLNTMRRAGWPIYPTRVYLNIPPAPTQYTRPVVTGSFESDGVYLYWIRVDSLWGYFQPSYVYEKRAASDLSLVASWDISHVIGTRTIAADGYPVDGCRIDTIHSARLAPDSGHLYVFRPYYNYTRSGGVPTWWGVYMGFDIIDVNLAAGTSQVLIDNPPPSLGLAAPGNTEQLIWLLQTRLPCTWANWDPPAGDLWFATPEYYIRLDGARDSRTVIWHSDDCGATWDAKRMVGGWSASDQAGVAGRYEMGAPDGIPVLLHLTPQYNGITHVSGFRVKGWDLADESDPTEPYWTRRPTDPNTDQDMADTIWVGYSQVPSGCPRFTHHTSGIEQRLLWPIESNFFLSGWNWGGAAQRGNRPCTWVFGQHEGADVILIQDRADLIHLFCVEDAALVQYRGPLADVAAGEPATIGDFAAPGAARLPDGELRLVAIRNSDGAIVELFSDDDGATWSVTDVLAALAGTTHHAICALGNPPSHHGAKGFGATYLLSAAKAGDILIYRAGDAHAWAEAGTLADDAPAQRAAIIQLADGSLRAYYHSSAGDILTAVSTDEGSSWSAAAAAVESARWPVAVALPHGGALLAFWDDDVLKLARSADGATFDTPITLRDAWSGEGENPIPDHGVPHAVGLARSAGGGIYLIFDFDGLQSIYSDDEGATWA